MKRSLEHMIKWIGYASIIGAMAILILVAYWLLWPYRWLAYYPIGDGADFAVSTPAVKRGEHLVYDVKYCRWNDISATFTKEILATDGSVGFTLPSFESSYGQNCGRGLDGPTQTTVPTTKIPETLPAGMYYMKMNVEQKINPLRTLRLSTTTEPFEVI